MNKSTIARIGALATSVALAFGAITATAGTAQAANIGGGCVTFKNGQSVKVDCETGKPISKKQQDRRANSGWDVYDARKADNGIFDIRLPKALRGTTVTVTADYNSGDSAPRWLRALKGDNPNADGTWRSTAQVKVTGDSITVAMPTSDYAGCYTIAVTVKGAGGKAYKYLIDGKGLSFTNVDNGYTDITILP